jgi:hypothetical protein
MVMSEVSLRRVEELLLGIALELRPALAIGNPSVLSIDRGHLSSVVAARRDGVTNWAPLLLVVRGPR